MSLITEIEAMRLAAMNDFNNAAEFQALRKAKAHGSGPMVKSPL
jgi:hypothetical protein